MAEPRPKQPDRHTVGFNRDNPVQARALFIYERLLPKTEFNSLGTLFQKVLVVFAEAAANHPAINSEMASQFITEWQEFQAWKAGQSPAPPAQPSPHHESPSPQSPPSRSGSGDGIDVDWSQL